MALFKREDLGIEPLQSRDWNYTKRWGGKFLKLYQRNSLRQRKAAESLFYHKATQLYLPAETLMRRLFVLIAILATMHGCASLSIHEDDPILDKVGKVSARTLLCVATSCFSEAAIARNAPIYPMATGSHEPLTDEQVKQGAQNRHTFVIWGQPPSAVAVLVTEIQKGGHKVVERSRVQELLNEQRFRLTNTPDSEADLLRVGRLIGADRIIFVETTQSSSTASSAYYHPQYGGGMNSQTLYNVSVSVRSVNVENGEIRWNGTAWYPSPINNPDQGVAFLTMTALHRAICPLERSYTWSNKYGCRQSEAK